MVSVPLVVDADAWQQLVWSVRSGDVGDNESRKPSSHASSSSMVSTATIRSIRLELKMTRQIHTGDIERPRLSLNISIAIYRYECKTEITSGVCTRVDFANHLQIDMSVHEWLAKAVSWHLG